MAANKTMGSIHNPFAKEKESKSPKNLSTIEMGRNADGSLHMQHKFAGYEHPPEDHPAADNHAALTHIAKHMGMHDVEIKHKGEKKKVQAMPAAAAAAPAENPQEEAAEETAEGEDAAE